MQLIESGDFVRHDTHYNGAASALPEDIYAETRYARDSVGKVSGAVLLFPITYIFGDVFTEVYGYAASRRAIWLGFLAMGLLSIFGAIAVALPPAPDWHNQQAFATVFALVPRFAIASKRSSHSTGGRSCDDHPHPKFYAFRPARMTA